MPQPNLKIMVDYNLIDPKILEGLENIGAIDIRTTIECGFDHWAKDEDLIKKGSEEDRILLTLDGNTINEKVFQPCNHGGVIIIDEKRLFPEEVVALVRAFTMCGQRGTAKKHVTYLKKTGAKIITHDKEPVLIDFYEKPSIKKIVKNI